MPSPHREDDPSAPPVAPRRGRPSSGMRAAIIDTTRLLLRERGASRLTTREVAQQAGVSEGSVFYHFGDRTGLLTAVITDALEGLGALYSVEGMIGVVTTFEDFMLGLEAFLDRILTVLVAAQSDAELRTGMVAFMTEHDLGPHRGVAALAAHLADQQAQGLVREDADVDAVATMLIGAVFLGVAQRQMISETYASRLPATADVLAAARTLLQPRAGDGESGRVSRPVSRRQVRGRPRPAPG